MSKVKHNTYSYTRKSSTVPEPSTSTIGLTWSGGITSSNTQNNTSNTCETPSQNALTVDTKSWFISNSTTADTSLSAKSTPTKCTKSTKEVAVDLSALESKCRQLLPYANTHKYSLPPKIAILFTEVITLGTRVAGTEQYNNFHTITNKVFAGHNSAIKGTVAQQFTGCSGGKSGCHEDCAGNFPDKHYTRDSFCHSHVGVYQNGEINIHYSPSKPCKVLLLHSTTQDIDMHAEIWKALSAKGISIVNVSAKDSKGVKEIRTHTNTATANKPAKKEHKRKKDDSSDWLIFLFIFIIVIVIIIALAYWGYSGYYSNNKVRGDVSDSSFYY